ncbi:MAG: sensor histidine kinase, partial [Actinomycetota bacterium]
RGVLIYRWVALAWMTTIAVTGGVFTRPLIAWTSIAAAGAWTVYLTLRAGRESRAVLVLDLGLCAWLVLASGVVVPSGDTVVGRPFFATGYPFSAVLLWGVSGGPGGGLLAGGLLGFAMLLTRPLNGVALGEIEARAAQNLAGSIINYLAAGLAVGLVSRLLVRSAEQAERATADLVIERERAARLAERESLARQIHDSVLQVLALIHKRGRELSARPDIDPGELARLSDIAGRQEEELRGLVMREPEPAPTGASSLRDALEATARRIEGVNVTVSSVGPIPLDTNCVRELAAAVRQALDNVVEHASATRASLFAEEDGDEVVVSIRDDGVGFDYDEDGLRARDKAGILKSMKGRVEDLGGKMLIATGPGRGTEVEFRVPIQRERS